MREPTIPVPAELADKLPTGRDPVTLVGPDGRPAAFVVSLKEYQTLQEARVRSMYSPPSPEELDRRFKNAEANGPFRTMEEVMKLVEGE